MPFTKTYLIIDERRILERVFDVITENFTLVGIIFNALGWFNSKIMSIAYFVISTLLGFALAYVVMLIETHLLEIGITLGVIFVLSIAAIILIVIKNKKQDTK